MIRIIKYLCVYVNWLNSLWDTLKEPWRFILFFYLLINLVAQYHIHEIDSIIAVSVLVFLRSVGLPTFEVSSKEKISIPKIGSLICLGVTACITIWMAILRDPTLVTVFIWMTMFSLAVDQALKMEKSSR
jgi:hypothetical protein